MFSCKVLTGPIATDREYHVGEIICLEQKDAEVLSGYNLVEIIEEVAAKFVPQALPATDVIEAAAPVAPTPEPVAVPPVVDSAPIIDEPTPVTQTEPVAVTPVVDSVPTPVVSTPDPATVTEVVDSAPIIDASAAYVSTVEIPAVETPASVVEIPATVGVASASADEPVELTPEEVLELEKIAADEVKNIVKSRKK